MATRKKSVKGAGAKKAAGKGVKKTGRKDRMVCFECGREVTIDSCGAAESALICCGHAMDKK